MQHLFTNTDADSCSLVDYLATFLDSQSESYNLFQLPPIQRNAVWNVAQIERLWDSVLRGYPIGSFLVSSRTERDTARDLYSGIQIKSANSGYFLLDGQQRTRALLLGFRPNEGARIWIDLNPNLIFDNVDLNDRKFLLRVLTSYQPWGMSDRNPSDKLSEGQKFNARGELGVKSLHYDYEVQIDNGGVEKSNIHSWPVRSVFPVPLDGLINLCGGTSGEFHVPDWKSVCGLVPQRYFSLNKGWDEPSRHFGSIIEGLKKIIDKRSSISKIRTIVLLYHNDVGSQYLENSQDNMEVLFRRVNAGGTVLEGEEMAYSLLKSSWDGAYDMVSEIVRNKSIGYLLSSTSIVSAATRIARFIQKKPDVPNPGIGNFRKWIGDREDTSSFLEIMQGLLQTNEGGKSKLHEIIDAFCKLVIYREYDLEDTGLPRKLLLSIKPSLFHPVFAWIYKNDCDMTILESSRQSILRYLVHCFLTVEKNDKASKLAMEIVKESDSKRFPDRTIYEALLGEELSVRMPTPKEFSKPFELPVDGFFRHYNDVFNIEGDSFNSFRHWFWHDSKELLLWFQRKHASRWFEGYDPTSDDAYDTPYDWDHIMPKSHLITSGASPEIYSNEVGLNKKFEWNRARYINSIGNYRLWPFWANRHDNNCCHTDKLRINECEWENDSVAKELGLLSTEDFLEASAIPQTDLMLWHDAGGEVRDWPLERRKAWQSAVERRVVYLFKTLFDDFGFYTWAVKS